MAYCAPGVSGLVVGMIASRIAENKGFDAITDNSLAYAINGISGCTGNTGAILDGCVGNAIATFHVPETISLLSAREYAELRARHEGVRTEFSRVVRDYRETARLDRITNGIELARKLDEISQSVGDEMEKFRASKYARSLSGWVPFTLASVIPVALGAVTSGLPGSIGGAAFSFVVRAAARIGDASKQLKYPRVLQTLCAAEDAAGMAEIRDLSRGA
jgi:hypothetical protein